MDIKAVSLGYAVPRKEFSACVHSAFRTSVNLRAEGINGLLTLSSKSNIDLPQGIRLDPNEEVYFHNLKPGQYAFCYAGFLWFQGVDLRIDLRKAYRWRCNLSKLDISLTNPASALAWSSIWETINAKQKQTGTEIVLEDLTRNTEEIRTVKPRKSRRAFRKLVLATRRFNPEAISAAGELIGLGSGLTPGGDDLLAGYLTGLWCTLGGKTDRRRFTSVLGQGIIDLSTGTNDISCTYLFHAAKGQAASYLVDLAQLIGQGEGSARLIDAIDIAVHVGHSSGMDAVTGLLFGLSVWTLPANSESAIPPVQLIM
jgi:hypothetical protein